MNKERYVDSLICQKLFRFDHLTISGMDNEPVARIFSDKILEQEFCLFARDIPTGDAYFLFLHERLVEALQKKRPLPVVRFADGEYAFYKYTLGCNGLYKQAESIQSIHKAMPQHIAAMKNIAGNGLLAPLVYPGNANVAPSGLLRFFRKGQDSGGADFLDFIHEAKIDLTGDNYVPFYLVYAYLTSANFARLMHNRNLVILNSEFNEKSCLNWFTRFESHPNIDFVSIPAEYVATHWEDVRQPILDRIPKGTDVCLTGAGVGALLICRDVASRFSIPAIDAGHVLNMMNDRVDKSNGARLYTLRKNP